MRPQYGSKLVKNANGFSVVISTENVFEVLDIVDDGENRWCHVVFKQDGVDYVGYINADYVLYVDGGEILDDPTQEVPTPAEPSPYPTDIPPQVVINHKGIRFPVVSILLKRLPGSSLGI